MLTQLPSIEIRTSQLLELERELFAASEPAQFKALQKRIAHLIVQDHVRTSSELDFFLQLAMLYIAACIHASVDEYKYHSYKIAIVIHSPDHEVLIVKPLFYYIGRCVAIQPTISLRSKQEGQVDMKHFGQTGVAIARGHCVYCPLSITKCKQYVPIEGNSGALTRTSLCIPIVPHPEEAISRFGKQFFNANSPCIGCSFTDCTQVTSEELLSRESSFATPIAALSIESDQDYLQFSPEAAFRLLNYNGLENILTQLHTVLSSFRQERDRYKTLKTCTALFDLWQHNLSEHQTYEALLTAISELSDGADVTYHVRDLKKADDETRSVRLVDGVGRNFRGFLINDRQSLHHGLIGKTLQNGDHAILYEEQIIRASQDNSLGFKQLMPDTRLNITVAIPVVHPPTYGVINIEWDEETLRTHSADRTKDEAYAKQKLKLIKTAVEYFSLAAQHIHSMQRDQNTASSLPSAEQIDRESDRRLSLSYYVTRAIERIGRRSQDDHRHYLQNIIDAAGYMLRSEKPHQLVLCLRLHNEALGTLELVGDPHGSLFFAQNVEPRPSASIRISEDSSVMGVAAFYRVPVFGAIRDKYLYPGLNCQGLPIDSDGRPKPVPYRRSGTMYPIYEVAVPIVIGNRLLGVLDLEQFQQHALQKEDREDIQSMSAEELSAFLEWTRAIALCIVYTEHLSLENSQLRPGARAHQAFQGLQQLVAQIVANVPLEPPAANYLATKYLRSLVQVDSVDYLSPAGIKQHQAIQKSKQYQYIYAPLQYRGNSIGYVRAAIGDHEANNNAEGPLFPGGSESETVEMAMRLFAAYQTAITIAADPSSRDRDDFLRWIESAEGAIRQAVDVNKYSDLDAEEFLKELFTLIHSVLKSTLSLIPNEEGSSPQSIYGWYIYQSTYDINVKRNTLVPGPPLARMISLDTYEMENLLKEVEAQGNGFNGLCKVLAGNRHLRARSPWKEILQGKADDVVRLRSYCQEIWGINDESSPTIRKIFIELLGAERYEHEHSNSQQGTSITQLAAGGNILTFPDVLRSPYRSEKPVLEWFFKSASYTIISVPILVEHRCLGVINLLRRRQRPTDFEFFKIEEVERAASFGVSLSKILAENIEFRILPLREGEPAREAIYGPSVQRLLQELAELPSQKVPPRVPPPESTLVISPLAEVPLAAKRVFEMDLNWETETVYFFESKTLKMKESSLAGKRVVTCFPLADISNKNSEDERNYKNLFLNLVYAKPTQIIILVSEHHRASFERCKPTEMTLHSVKFQKENFQDNWQFFLDNFGKVSPHKMRLLQVELITRRKGRWSLEGFKETCWGDGSQLLQLSNLIIDAALVTEDFRPYGNSLIFSRRLECRIESNYHGEKGLDNG